MFKKLLSALGTGRPAPGPGPAPRGLYQPYAQEHVNFFYNLLFCDDLELFRRNDTPAGEPWTTLLAATPDLAALSRIAGDESGEGRVRALAYKRLRDAGQAVPSRKLLGVIVEVPLDGGLDVLAAFCEGGVRYLNQSGKIAIFEGAGNPVEALAKELVSISQAVVDRIGPWEKSRLPPPKAGNVRLSFLVSDGLYFGEGPFELFQRDPMAGPVLGKASQLLQKSVDVAVK